MAKGDMNILDLQIDHADGPALDRVNVHFTLGIPRARVWGFFREPNHSYRERVRAALRRKWSEPVAGAEPHD